MAKSKLLNTIEEMFCQNPDEIFTSTAVANYVEYMTGIKPPPSRVWVMLSMLRARGTIKRTEHGSYQAA